jgi:hypothetical protein
MNAFLCVDVWGTSGEMTKFLAALVSGRAKGKALVNSRDCEDTEAVRIICTMALAKWSCGTSSVWCLVKNRSLPEEKLTP